MAKAWCLIPDEANKFLKGLKEGTINPDELARMTPEKRHEFIAKVVGKDNATQVNGLFESKLLLKNQQQGMITWAKKVGGISKTTRRDLIARIEKMDTILNPKSADTFFSDLVETKLGVGVTQQEAKTIFDLSQKVRELAAKTDVTKSDIALGRAKLDVVDYVNSLVGKKANLITNLAGIPKSIMSSLDFSAPLNQGWGLMSRKQFYTNLGNMFKYAGSKGKFRDLQAWTITHPQYDLAKKAGLRLTDLGGVLSHREEQFMSTLVDRIPGISASQRAYTGFLNKIRMDVFDDLIKKAEVAGENVTLGSKAAEDIAKVVNNFSGGARVGAVEGATPFLNAVFFSPRKIASTLQMMNPVNYVNPKISKTARNAATRNLIGSLALSAGVISLYSILTGRKQEADPTSTDFGKIKSGDTRIDVTGGNATYLSLLSRIVTGKMKSSSGITRELGTGFGQKSAFDLLAQFGRYKLSPNASFLVDAVVKANAIGEKKTITESAIDRFKPMFGNSVYELLKSDTDGKFAFALGGLFGGGLNTFSNTETDWSESTGKELTQFKEKVGEDKFKEANNKFNTSYDEWLSNMETTDAYKNLSDESKQTLLTNKKADLKDEVFKEYGFKYKQKKDTPEEKQEKNKIKNLLKTEVPANKEQQLSLMDRLVPSAHASEGENSAPVPKGKDFFQVLQDFFFPPKELISPEAKSKNDPFLQKGWIKIGVNSYKWPGTGEVKTVKESPVPSSTRTPKAKDWNEFTAVASNIAKAAGFPPSVLLGQAAVETGRNMEKAKGNNWFGIKGEGSGGSTSQNTEEEIDGKRIKITADFGAYEIVEDSVNAYIDWVKNHVPDYEKLKDDPEKLVQAIKDAGYATDSKYVWKVTNTPEFKNLNPKKKKAVNN